MKTVVSLKVNDGVRLVLIEEGNKTEWRFCQPVDDNFSRVPERNSPEEMALVLAIPNEDKVKLLKIMDDIDKAYELLLTGKAMGGLHGRNI
jgi:hypothetical protein